MAYWLMKTEPQEFSFADLLEQPQQTAMWDGVRNYQVRNFMRDAMRCGDSVLIYHSNAKPPGVAGIAEIVREAYPDPTQFDPQHPHYDPKASQEAPRWLAVDVQAVRWLERFLPLAELRSQDALQDMPLLRRGNRLSIMPVSAEAFAHIVAMAQSEAAG